MANLPVHDVGEVVVVAHCINGERQEIIKVDDTAFALQRLDITHDFGDIGYRCR